MYNYGSSVKRLGSFNELHQLQCQVEATQAQMPAVAVSCAATIRSAGGLRTSGLGGGCVRQCGRLDARYAHAACASACLCCARLRACLSSSSSFGPLTFHRRLPAWS